MSIEKKTNPISLYGVRYNDKTLYYKLMFIEKHFHRIFNLISKYCEIRMKEMNNIFHDKIKCKELIKKLSESRINIFSDDEKRKLIIKIKNEVEYIKKNLLKEEYNQKLEYKIIDYNYFYEVSERGHNHLLSYIDILSFYNIYLIDADEVYEIVSKNKK